LFDKLKLSNNSNNDLAYRSFGGLRSSGLTERQGVFMFSYFSQVKAKGGKLLFAALVMVLLMGFFAGCDSGSDPVFTTRSTIPNELLGRWVDPVFEDGYEFTSDTYKQFSPEMEWDGVIYPGLEKTGTVRFVTMFDSSSGVIIFEYTSGASDVSKPFSAAYFRDLTSTSVRAGIVINLTDYSSVDVATLEEASVKFTYDTRGNYIGSWGGPYAKQE